MLNLTSSMFVETYPTEGAMPTVAIKDCIDIAGRVTACGSRALADSQPAPRHAAVVQALADVGWRIAAKASMHELAYGMTGINGWTGTVPNPLYPGRIAGDPPADRRRRSRPGWSMWRWARIRADRCVCLRPAAG